ncbi:MAG: hypothetical protein Q8L68_02045 [Methylococcales bacterium]|nr:hypothetical protein [Methylococcales bacterium]
MNSLEMLISLAKTYGFGTHCYIDRLSVYFDARVPETDLLKLKKLSPKNKLIQPCTLEGHIHLSQKLELYQLDDVSLKLLSRICKSSGGDYKITYIELAMDFYSASKEDVNKLRLFFNRHLVRLGKSSKKQPYFHDAEGTHYFNKKADSVRMVMYSNKPYRWDKNYFCVHLECRYSGLDALKSIDIITAKDITDFDHLAYWKQCLDLRKPNFKAIGENSAENNVSEQALNKRGSKFFDRLKSLQKYLNENPELIKDKTKFKTLFPPMNTNEALEKFFSRALEPN